MGLKFERSNDLDKLFDSFAVDPLKKEVPLEELAKQRQEVKKKTSKRVILLVFSIEIFNCCPSCFFSFFCFRRENNKVILFIKIQGFLMTLSCLFHLPRGILSALVATIITGKS